MQVFRNRLSQYVTISDDIWEQFRKLDRKEKVYLSGEDIIQLGQKVQHVFILTEGWAIRYRALEDGRRQIVNFMLPGDIFDLQVLAGVEADHSITAITKVTVQRTCAEDFIKALRNSGEMASAFWWAAVQEESILREQIVRVGRRTARERIGHLLLELQRRYQAALGAESNHLPLPLTRTDLADALGLTPVHVSRTMSALRQANLIREVRGSITILDPGKLARMSHFDMDYLHMRKLSFQRQEKTQAHRSGLGSVGESNRFMAIPRPPRPGQK